ncbi:unnamed protein product [Arctogadus glacialis]
MDGYMDGPHQPNRPGCKPVSPRNSDLSADTETGNRGMRYGRLIETAPIEPSSNRQCGVISVGLWLPLL